MENKKILITFDFTKNYSVLILEGSLHKITTFLIVLFYWVVITSCIQKSKTEEKILNVNNGTVHCNKDNSCILKCTMGFGDCDGDMTNGCEINLTKNNEHCGECGKKCGPKKRCNGFICECIVPWQECECEEEGFAMCGGSCIDIRNDPQNCGDCDIVCSFSNVASVQCTNRICVWSGCNEGYEDRDKELQTGCEYGGRLPKVYDFDRMEYSIGYSIVEDMFGNYILAATNNSNNKMFIFSTDKNGNILWRYRYDFYTDFTIIDSWPKSILLTENSDIIVAGSAGGRIMVMRVSPIGKFINGYLYSLGNNISYAREISKTSDGGFILTGLTGGNTKGEGTEDGDVFVMKLDNNLLPLWGYIYGNVLKDEGYSIKETSDGGYIVSGVISSYTSPCDPNHKGECPDIFVMKTDNIGNPIWQREIKKYGREYSYKILENPKKNYIVAGWMNTTGASDSKCLLIEIDKYGNVLWSNTYIAKNDEYWYTCESRDIIITNDGEYLLGATGISYGLLFKIKPNGEPIWVNILFDHKHFLESLLTTKVYSVIEDSNNNFISTGLIMKVTISGTSLIAVDKDGFIINDNICPKIYTLARGFIHTENIKMAIDEIQTNYYQKMPEIKNVTIEVVKPNYDNSHICIK